ncbi:hypothetical protein CONCODRAFT_10903 [Conidiobolus coronatus NRRL 28638]|uniref:Galactose oxidase n=1 Tax=Conidiobolus coronatus (strain ATCC 28846 / CBS 209.66 / NRRL 28638) TaxID=796925 RepID=A0A137NW98_CONC2|nr:hypothetical protein CONCODRAFT_10903 [Conidiobolus coronatus NRRL 28638]|eukprot:KXN67105.1 hypothetical protein CONCODRAFT_10903 [Conidiobolus coronatus NRRL 28638]
MNFLIFFIFISYALGLTEYKTILTSAIHKNGKMYIYEPIDEKISGTGLYVYTLKDGLISDNKPNIVNITNGNWAYTPQFLNLPPGLPNGRSDQLWMISALYEEIMGEKEIEQKAWSGQILNDKELSFESSFIRKPDFENFPVGAFSLTITNVDNNPTLHVIGGLIYSKKLKNVLITNYHFKYEFNTEKWTDLSKNTKSILQPVAYHKVVQANNSLILVGGTTQYYATKGNFTHTVPSNSSTPLRITDIYKFDLSTEKWSLVNAKLNLKEEVYERGIADGQSLDIYNGKLISYMAIQNTESNNHVPKLATLDYKAEDWEWTWVDIKNEGGSDNTLVLYDHHTLIINDQLLLFHGNTNDNDSNNVYAIDLKNNKLQSFMNISGNYSQQTDSSSNPQTDSSSSQQPDSSLPKWAIILISVICVIVLILTLVGLWFYFRYRKLVKPNEKNDQTMQEIWAAFDTEAGGSNKAEVTLTSDNTASSSSQSNSICINNALMSYDYFKHEVDLQDMENTNAIAKI